MRTSIIYRGGSSIGFLIALVAQNETVPANMRLFRSLSIIAVSAVVRVSAVATIGQGVQLLNGAKIVKDVKLPPFNRADPGNRTVTINGVSTVIDLSAPDVTIHPNGVLTKPLAPGAFFQVDSQPSNDSLVARQDPRCSIYYWCSNTYVLIPSGYELLSHLTIHAGQGAEHDSSGWGMKVSGGTYNAFGGASVFSHNYIENGCLFSWQAYGCTFDCHGDLGSWNNLYSSH